MIWTELICVAAKYCPPQLKAQLRQPFNVVNSFHNLKSSTSALNNCKLSGNPTNTYRPAMPFVSSQFEFEY